MARNAYLVKEKFDQSNCKLYICRQNFLFAWELLNMLSGTNVNLNMFSPTLEDKVSWATSSAVSEDLIEFYNVEVFDIDGDSGEVVPASIDISGNSINYTTLQSGIFINVPDETGFNGYELSFDALTDNSMLTIMEARLLDAANSLSLPRDNVFHTGDAVYINVDGLAFGTGDSFSIVMDLSFVGNSLSNEFIGGDGNDFASGGAGHDTLRGEDGHDELIGGRGSDWLYGGTDNDILIGGFGDDVLIGNYDKDQLFGGIGNDVLKGRHGTDYLVGDVGNDTMEGGSGADLIEGNAGKDSVLGGSGGDTIDGGAGTDVLSGDAGSDLIFGGGGADLMFGGDGYDELIGGDGSDSMIGGGEGDYLTGGSGADLFVFNSLEDSLIGPGEDIITDFETGSDQIDFSTLVPELTVSLNGGLTGSGPSARTAEVDSDTAIYIDFDGNGSSDMRIILDGTVGLSLDDFIV
ncbi:calcium-binding protein [Psychromarinibacter halotolerans]|nr:calcium-binding protein [Psychromarinibacter halotolerans]